MMYNSVFTLCLVVSSCLAASLQDPDVPQEEMLNSINSTTDDAVKELMGKECRGGYSPFCLKLGLMKLVGRGAGMTLPLLPGVVLTSKSIPQGPPTSASTLMSQPDRIDALLLDRMADYLGSLTLNVRIMDKSVPIDFAKAYLGDNAASGRKRDKYGGALAAAGLMSGGTMLAVGMAALAAMAGKALMASVLALMLAGIAALSKGQGDEKTTYEIVAKPIVSHQHTHSSEVIHGHGHHHYKRSLEAHQLAYAQQNLQ